MLVGHVLTWRTVTRMSRTTCAFTGATFHLHTEKRFEFLLMWYMIPLFPAHLNTSAKNAQTLKLCSGNFQNRNRMTLSLWCSFVPAVVLLGKKVNNRYFPKLVQLCYYSMIHCMRIGHRLRHKRNLGASCGHPRPTGNIGVVSLLIVGNWVDSGNGPQKRFCTPGKSYSYIYARIIIPSFPRKPFKYMLQQPRMVPIFLLELTYATLVRTQ